MLEYLEKLEELEGKKMRIIEVENGRMRRFQQPIPKKLISDLLAMCKVVEIQIDENGRTDIIAQDCESIEDNDYYGWQ